MQVANLFVFVGLRVRLVSEISRALGMCPDRNTARRPRSSHEAPPRTHSSIVPAARTVCVARPVNRLGFKGAQIREHSRRCPSKS